MLQKQDFAAALQSLPGTAGVVNAVTKDENGIGFGGAAYGAGIKFAKLKVDAASPAIALSKETVLDGTYPISRALFMYTRTRPEGALKGWVDWILAKEGQSLVEEVGYFPLK